MPDLSIFKSPAPYHIIAYNSSALAQSIKLMKIDMELSSEQNSFRYDSLLYRSFTGLSIHPQTFVGGIISYQALPRPQFSQLQQKLFPYYFSLQTALPAALALTYPGSRTSLGPASSLSGTFAGVNRWTVLAPLATIFLTSAVNMFYCGPETTRIMRKRKHQG
jgi:hypothetical protein